MATQLGTGKWIAKSAHQVTWAALANGDIGTDSSDVTLPVKAASVSGTFGAAGSVSFEGSNDGTNYFILKDWNGSAITFTAAGIKTIVDNPRLIRPHCTNGDGTTALVCILVSQADS